jgi:NADH-quinone oxidoreductase subunit L
MDILAPLVLLMPLAGFLVNALFGRLLPRRVVGWVGAGSIGLAFIFALVIFSQVLGGQKLDQSYFSWWQSGDFNVPFNLYVDALSTLMILVITGVGFLIHVYSIGYMREDPGFSRFFAYMNLFVFSMLLLVLSGNLVWLIIGWAGSSAARRCWRPARPSS